MQFGLLAESHPYNPLWAQLGYVVQLSTGVYTVYVHVVRSLCESDFKLLYLCIYNVCMCIPSCTRHVVLSNMSLRV